MNWLMYSGYQRLCVCIHTRHSYMLLNEADIFLGVLRQLLKASSSRGVTVPASQRLILDLYALQHLLIGWCRINKIKGVEVGERRNITPLASQETAIKQL